MKTGLRTEAAMHSIMIGILWTLLLCLKWDEKLAKKVPPSRR